MAANVNRIPWGKPPPTKKDALRLSSPAYDMSNDVKDCLRPPTSSVARSPSSVLFPCRQAVVANMPSWMAVQSLANLSFSSRDFYSNDITIGYGDDAFQAWSTTAQAPEVSQRVIDVGGGSYVAQLHTYNHTGMSLFFVQRHGLNIPGSPFEVRREQERVKAGRGGMAG